jgi:hypothetical protein
MTPLSRILGHLDVALALCDQNGVAVFRGSSVGLSGPSQFATATCPTEIVAGDFNGDGRPDLATRSYQTGTLSVFLNDGAGGFAVPVEYTSTPFSFGHSAGDLNGDGLADLVASTAAPMTPAVALAR